MQTLHSISQRLTTTTWLKKTATVLLISMIALSMMQSCNKDDDHTSMAMNSSKYVAFNSAVHQLWSDHMQWTYATVDAFFNNPDAVEAQLNRLLQNQKDMGAAIVPYYGQAAGDTLASLLTIHIQQAVPVLQAAKNGDQAALDKALADWNANAEDIADFLSAANPQNWKQADMREMMKGHITQTTTYAVDLLQKNYNKAVADYQTAYDHMMMMADMLAEGIAKQFPDKF